MELDFVAHLRARLPDHARLKIGVGDDAALIEAKDDNVVVTTDLLIDGVHFQSALHTPEMIGRKALATNLSDLAAMAARPLAAVVSLALPHNLREGAKGVEYASRLLEGMLTHAEKYDCPIAGGDTNTGPGPLVVSVTVFGEPTERGVLRRDGAQSGDWILVTGSLGGSLAGKHLAFEPRIEEALLIRQQYDLHAGMDTTDGLAMDIRRLAQASHVGVLLEANAIPIAEAVQEIAQESNLSPLEHALGDGEDFELLLAAPPAEAKRLLRDQPIACGVTQLGECTTETDMLLRDESGAVYELPNLGYEHY